MTAPTRRLFFALWPDEATRREIARRRDALGPVSRRQVPDENLHLTLVFLGDQPAARVDGVLALAGSVRAPAFELVLDRFGWFPRAGVVWLGGEAPEAGRELAGELERGVERLGLEPDRRTWRPHVTLFRKVRGRPRLPPAAPLAWPVSSFALVESVPGKPYQVLRSWPLQ